MKKTFTLLTVLALSQISHAQVIVHNFDTVMKVSFKDYTGKLDSNFANPSKTGINTSAKVGRYIRDTATFDNIKFYAHGKFVDLTPYESTGSTAKMSLKVWSKMPAGSKVEIQMGIRGNNSWPTGVHSEYVAITSKTGEWEKLTFNFVQKPVGGFAHAGMIDKGVILFRPGAHTNDTIYFDELSGPGVEAANSINEMIDARLSVSQNHPNPAKDNTTINLELNTAGHVSIVIYDLLGKAVSTVVDSHLQNGPHSFNVNTENLPNGVYFYTVKKGSDVKAMKMTVSK